MNHHRKKMIPIAVIGAAIRLPQANNLNVFWDHLVNARDLISEVPAERWDWKKHYDPQSRINTTQSKWSGFLDRIDRFDAAFFRISNREANLMDPQQRILLELTWEAFEDAGYKASELSGSRTGVFIGACHNDYSELIDRNLTEIDAYITTGTCTSILANRLSYFYNFHGPSLTINTACSSSLVAVHQALQSLQTGESEWAIAGGVNLCLTPKLYIASSRAGMLAKDGRCKTFAEGADGYVRGEGAGVVLLKPLEKAIVQGDHIYAVIRGSAANHGGAVNSITVPNPQAQAELIAEAYSRARIRPERVTYIETHGTGTALGDPIEVFGLKKAFQQLSAHFNSQPSKKYYCGLGSVKTNIGHLEAAAGIAGLIKVLLSLQHHKIPAILHLEKVNRLIDIKDSPFYFATRTKDWEPSFNSKKKPVPRVAGISSFGFGGANAHVILEEYPESGNASLKKSHPELILLSARNQESLRAYVRKMTAFCAEHISMSKEQSGAGAPRLRDLAFTLQMGREEMEERLAIIADDIKDLHKQLSIFSDGGAVSAKKVFQGQASRSGAIIKAGAKDINQAIRKKDLVKLGRCWVSGHTIHWKAFYSRRPGKRISLPTYAFDRQAHWVPLKLETTTPLPDRTTLANRPEPLQAPLRGRLYEGKIRLKTPGSAAMTETIRPDMPRAPEMLRGIEKSEAIITVASGVPVRSLERGRTNLEIKTIIKEKLAQTLYADPSALDENKPFAEIGLDSILAVELIKSLNQEFGIDLKASKLYDYATITLLAEFLSGMILMRKEAVQAGPNSRAERSASSGTAVPEKEEARSAQVEVSVMEAKAAEQNAGHENLSRDIAIIGMSGRFPGAENLEEYWQNLVQGRDCVTEIPLERWDVRQHYNPDPTVKNKSYGKWGGFLKNIDLFDPLFFNISPAEAKIMDPHQRLVLEEAWKALEDAGYSAFKLNRIKCGLFVGTMSGEEYFPHIYNLRSIMASRLAYFLNLKGPTIALDTACSSALVAVHLACKSLMEAETELMIAGGVSLYLTEKLFVQMSQVKMLSFQGKNRPFDDRADGIVPAEGVGMVVLKRLDKALADRDRIYGIIKGSGVNQDGRTNSITAPSLESQKNLEIDVYRRAQIHPETISYVEAHGTGTKLGDPIEIDALTEAFAEFTQKKQYCAIGSVKSNLGHTSAAAGMASLIKVALAMQYGRIPPTIHYEKENQHIRFKETPFYVVTEVLDWKADPNVPRRAAVSAFGIGGTNVHLVMEEHRTGRAWAVNPALQRQAMVFSAKNRERLQEYVKQFRAFISKPEFSIAAQKDPAALLTTMAYTLQTGREPLKERLAVLVSDLEELKSALDQYLHGAEESSNIFSAFSGPNPFGNEALPAKEDRRQIAGLIFQKQLAKLARLWVRGYEIDWVLLYGKDIPIKMSLPGYALDRRRYWKEEPEGPQVRLTPLGAAETAAEQTKKPEEHSIEENPPSRARTSVSGIFGEKIVLHIKRELADILCIEQKNLDDSVPMQELGLDSIFAVELTERLNRAFRTSIKATELYNYPTIRRFAEYLENELHNPTGKYNVDPAVPVEDRSEDKEEKVVFGSELNRKKVQDQISQHLADILSLEASVLDAETPLQEFGLDSIFAVELAERISKSLHVSLKATELYNYPNLNKLTGYVLTLFSEQTGKTAAEEKSKSVLKAVGDSASIAPEANKLESSTLKKLVLKPNRPDTSSHSVSFATASVSQKTSQTTKDGEVQPTDIAVIGMAGRFPGAANVAEFWHNLAHGVDSVTAAPSERWPDAGSQKFQGGFLKNIDCFDPLFFHISPMEAEVMDPQQRLILEEAWNAFEDAGYSMETLSGKKCGVFIGVSGGDYLQHMEISEDRVNAYQLMGTSHSILTARISYWFNLVGPAMAIDTACSSSLVAVYEACQSILHRESEMALAGGVSVLTTPQLFIMGAKAGMLSEQGRCRAFDQEADGFVMGEGVGVVVLKPLKNALEDRDHVYGVIRAWGINQDGKTNGLTAPNGLSQSRLMSETYEKFNINPENITYIEAHGTGTKLGDPIEANALVKTFHAHTTKEAFCGLGSVKSNIGHSLAAAGVAGLIKVLNCFANKKLPPSLHFRHLNKNIDFQHSPFYVNTMLKDWIVPEDQARWAAISSFGFSGTNCHLVLQEGPARTESMTVADSMPHVIVLSAESDEQLKEYAKKIVSFLVAIAGQGEMTDARNGAIERAREHFITLADMAYTLQVGRKSMKKRLATIVRTFDELRERLQAYLDDRLNSDDEYIYTGAAEGNEALYSILTEGDAGKAFIQALFSAKELGKIAKLWVAGVEINWKTIYGDYGPYRISLPTYPFKKKRFWVNSFASSSSTESVFHKTVSPKTSEDGGLTKQETNQQKHIVCLKQPADGNARSNDLKADVKSISLKKIKSDAVRIESAEPLGTTFIESQKESGDEVYIKTILKEEIGGTLYLDESEMDDNKPFLEMGMDSILAVELMKKINARFGLSVKANKLYDFFTVNKLSGYLSKNYGEVIKALNRPLKSSAEMTAAIGKGAENGKKPSEPEAEVGVCSGFSTATMEDVQEEEIANEDIAVIGISGRFPGAVDVYQFWRNLKNGVDSVTELPKERQDNEHADATKAAPNKTYYGGFISDIDMFDASFFDISPAEAELLMPQQRLVLEEAWKAFEDAGYSPKSLNNLKCGIFLGVMGDIDYPGEHIYNANSIMASRIAYLLNLRGPAIALDTACSSSLVAAHLACKSLLNEETDMMLAGGVSLYLTEKSFREISKAGMLSPDGRCKAFDDDANGFVPADGVGFVLLKKLEKAVKDKDFIYGIIKGSGINQDGKTNGITAPNSESQKDLILEVYKNAHINPESITYVETHGTGTKLGDPIEMDALTEAFQQYTEKKQFCAIGSVKSNIGHASAAAGVAGLLKILLSFQFKQIPPSLHLHKENQAIDFKQTPFFVNTKLCDWASQQGLSRKAALSSFGYSGTNAHLVLEEYNAKELISTSPYFADSKRVILLSAKVEENLVEHVKQMIDYLKHEEPWSKNGTLNDIAYTLCSGREAMKFRLAIMARDKGELENKLIDFIQNKTVNGVYTSEKVESDVGRNHAKAEEIQTWIQNREIEKLAAAWVSGSTIDWRFLFENENFKRIPLPKYPFSKKQYWLKSTPQKSDHIPSQDMTENPGRPFRANQKIVSFKKEEDDSSKIRDYLKRILSKATKYDISEIDDESQLSQFGVDSIVIVNLCRLIEEDVGEISKTIFFEYQTINDLVGYFTKNYKHKICSVVDGHADMTIAMQASS